MTKTIGFIGVGNMGKAIIKGLATLDGLTIYGTDLNRESVHALQEEGVMTAVSDAKTLASQCDYIVLAVKPQHAKSVVQQITPHLRKECCLISIAAGLRLQNLQEWSGNICPVVRIMPNTPALVNKGVYGICLDDPKLTGEQIDFIPQSFGSIGQIHILEEKMFDAFTALVGAGPAYVMYFMEALVESGVHLGLPREQATNMVKALFEGSVKMACDTGEHMSILREMVTSPAGSTIRALAHFDRTATRGNILDGVLECYERNKELGEE